MRCKKIFLFTAFFVAAIGFLIWNIPSNKKRVSASFLSNPMAFRQIPMHERYNKTISKGSKNGPMLSPETVEKIKLYHKDNNLPWSPYMDALDEETVLKDTPLEDINDIACVEKSVISVIGEKPTYVVGDEIRLHIQLYDYHGRRRPEGGDRMQVRIVESSLNASARGYILDHMNGTYTAVVKCLWPGRPSISVFLDILRPAIRLYYHFFNTYYYMDAIHATYTDTSIKPCQPFEDWLNTTSEICNMTEINGDMSYFCEAPESKDLSCNNVDEFMKREIIRNITPTTDAERQLLERFSKTFIVKNLKVLKKLRLPTGNFPLFTASVTEPEINPITQELRPPCFSYNRTKLWFLPSPVGHFMYNEWVINHCSAPSTEEFEKCLEGKRVLIFGDSTAAQWFRDLMYRFSCNETEVEPNNSIYDHCYHRSRLAFCEQNNLKLELVLHSLPGNIYRNCSISIAEYILKYQHMKNVAILIHYFAHVVREHPRVFRDRIRRTRQGIEEFLKINQDCHFFIKGCHFYGIGETYRYANYVYRLILIEEFKGLYDKVTFLDQVDSSISENHEVLHPRNFVVHGMVNQMLSYLCI